MLCALVVLGLQLLLGIIYSATSAVEWRTHEISCSGKQLLSTLGDDVTDNMKVTFAADCYLYNLTVLVNIAKTSRLYIKGSEKLTIRCTKDHSGLSFTNVSDLRLENLHLQFCGSSNADGLQHISSINITNCKDVDIRGIRIENSKGTALALVNTGGRVGIRNCTLQHNGDRKYSRRSEESFITDYMHMDDDYDKRGGGLQIMIGGDLRNSSYAIENCSFFNNMASSAGGLFLVVHQHAKRNQIIINNCTFRGNKCKYGGGGLQVGYMQDGYQMEDTIIENSILLTNCMFERNAAEYGGGTDIVSTQGVAEFAQNKLNFSKCTWSKNSAILGLAIDIYVAQREIFSGKHALPSLVFANCEFSQNRANEFSNFIVNNPRSAFVVSGFKVQFQGELKFKRNAGSAIEATSTILDFQANCTAKFIGNIGITGGALQLKGLTLINIRDHSHFLFVNNTADRTGGAIYVETNDKHSFFSPDSSCFVQYQGGDQPKNVSIVFENNKADFTFRQINKTKPVPMNYRYRGDSLYASTLIPCIREWATRENMSIDKILGNVSFDKTNRQFSTAASHFLSTTAEHNDNLCLFESNDTHIASALNHSSTKSNSIRLHIIPGKNESLPIKLVDELCGNVFFHVKVRVIKPRDTSLFVHPAQRTITDNFLTLYGDPDNHGLIQISTVGVRENTLAIVVTIDECPPGYIHDIQLKKCRCSTDIRNSYIGIGRCNETVFRAYIKPGYWVGYLSIENRTREQSLASAICPLGFCKNDVYTSAYGLLPASSSKNLSRHVCNSKRLGIICGSCKEKYSVYYHSMSFSCNSNDLCHWGWAFYILSELIPITIIFLVVIFFNISFTSGPLNGVVFFMQVVDTMKIRAENFIQFNETTLWVLRIIHTVYRMFSLNVLAVEELSFCLWPGATALDMLAFRYVTITYSLFLVISTVFFLRMCNFQRLFGKKVPSLRHSILHGLSAFLVMNYSECTKVSLSIFTKGTLRVGPSNSTIIIDVTFYNGQVPFLGREHLKYAIPAIFFILTMVSIPPLLLLSYPLCYKLFALLRIEESRFVQITCKILPLEKIKPLFDSIQGDFKDRYRFFAGLYFLYRLCALLTFSYTDTLTTFYIVTEIQLICMLFLHAACNPYKKTWHNILDAALLSNLAVVNAITLFNYQESSKYENSDTNLVVKNTGIQSILVLLPLVYLVSYTIYHIVKKIKAVTCESEPSTTENDDTDNTNAVFDTLDLHTRSLEDSLMEINDYMLLAPEPENSEVN